MIYSESHILSKDHTWIVFIHGAGGNISTWKYQIPFFKKHYNILCFDLKGHGKSPSQNNEKPYTFDSVALDIKAIMDEYSIEKAVLIGLSIGSLISHKFYNKYPDCVICIIGSGGIYGITNKIYLFTKLANILVRIFPYHFLYRFFALIVMPKANHRKSREIFIQASSKIVKREYLRWLNLYSTFRETVKSIRIEQQKIPTLIIMGKEDHLFLKPALAFCSSNKGVDIEIIPNCGHICNIEKAEVFNNLVFEFLKERNLHFEERRSALES